MFIKDVEEGEGDELVALTLVEFVLELNPVQTQSVQETFHYIHN